MGMKRFLAFVLLCSMLLGVMAVGAEAVPAAFPVSRLISAAEQIAGEMEEAIKEGEQDSNGVYSNYAFPATFAIDGNRVEAPAYIRMAAEAVLALSRGQGENTSVAYETVTVETDPVSCGAGSLLTKGQYTDLAERITVYAEATGGRLPSSFNRPTGYEGRVSIYSAAHGLTQVLRAYGAGGALPETVSFLPTHYFGEPEPPVTETEPTETEPAPTEPEPVNWFAEVIATAVKVKTSMDSMVIPSSVQVGSVTVSPGQFLYLACHVTVGINKGQTTGELTVPVSHEPENPSGSATGKVYLSDYVSMAQKIITFVETNQQPPNYATSSSIGAVHYYDLVHMYTKILNYYSTNGALPNYNTVEGWRGSVKTASVELPKVTKAAAAPMVPAGPEDMIVADWVFTDTVKNRGTDGAAKLMADYAKAGITDVYLLCKGLAGKVAWASSVPGTLRENSSRDFLKEVCDAAEPYGIRVHPWLMASRDTNYINNNGASCAFYHFRVGTSGEVNQFINLRDTGYRNYMSRLVKELVENYNIAGIHLDTIRYGGLYYDWGSNTRQLLIERYGITKAEYNAAVKSMCVAAGYSYSINSEGYYVYGSSYSASGAEFGSVIYGSGSVDAQNGVKKVAQLRKDTVTDFVKVISDAAGEDKVISCAIMPETCNNKYESALYGQSPEDLADVLDYVTIMSYSSEYQGDRNWPLTLAKACSAVGCNSVIGIQVYPSEGASDPDPNGKIIYEEAYNARNLMTTDSCVKGYAFFRGSYLNLASATVVNSNTIDFTVIPGDDANNASKYVFTLQNGLTCSAVTNKVGWPSGTTFSISSDKKTVTISKSGSTILSECNYGSFRMTVSGTVDEMKGAAMLRAYKGTSYTEGYGYCALMVEGHTHSYSPKITTPATCTAEGVLTYTCECGEAYTEAIPMTGHSYAPSTQEATGKVTYICTVCTDSYVADCGYTHTRVETWAKGNNTHFALCYVCKKTVTETCTPGQEERVEPTADKEGWILYSCTGSTGLSRDLSVDAFSGRGCGCSYKEVLPYIPDPDPVEDAALKLYHSLNLADDISLNYLVPAAALEGFDMDTVYAECRYYTYTGNTKGEEVVVEMKPVLNGAYYYFVLEGLTAVHMSTELTCTLYGTKEGLSYYSPVDKYSIAQYAYSQLNNPSREERLKILCADLLRYGGATQTFKGYRTDSLADSSMTPAHRAYLTDLNALTLGNTNMIFTELEEPSVTWVGKTLDLNTKVTVVYVVNTANYTADPTALTLRLTYQNHEGRTVTAEVKDPAPYGSGGNQYAFRFDGLLAAELRAVLSAHVMEGNTPVSDMLIYSADTYGNNKTGALGTLCRALFAYSDSAKAYFAK